jgi:nucleoside-diphosphate-sugar epimerase
MKVFLSGGEGIIGSSFRQFLNKKRFPVILLDTDYKKNISRFSLETIVSITHKSFQQETDSDAVFIHSAGLSNLGKCEANPILAHEANVHLTLDCLEYALKANCKFFVLLSTGFIYGDQSNEIHSEDSKIFASNIYLKTKYLAEKVCKDFSRKHDIKCIVLRLGNVYGVTSSPETVVGRIISQVVKGKNPLEVYTTKPVRDFLYMEDLNEALYQVISKPMQTPFEIYNVSNGQPTSVGQIIKVCQKINGSIKVKETKTPLHQSHLVLNTNKFKKMFNWSPRFSLLDGITEILNKYE